MKQIYLAIVLCLSFTFSTASHSMEVQTDSVETRQVIKKIPNHEFLALLQQKMPLQITRFLRRKLGGRVYYVIGLDSTGIRANDELVVKFDLSEKATLGEITKAVEGAASFVSKELTTSEARLPLLPGTSLGR